MSNTTLLCICILANTGLTEEHDAAL